MFVVVSSSYSVDMGWRDGWKKYGTSLDDGAEVDPSTHPSPDTHSKILQHDFLCCVEESTITNMG